MTELQAKIHEAAQTAQEAFWAVIAQNFPEAKTGDLSPAASKAFDDACLAASASWVQCNTDQRALAFVDMSRFTEFMLDIPTSHIPQHTAKALGDTVEASKAGPLWNVLSYVHWHEYGWIISCQPDYPDEIRADHPELAALIKFCLSHRLSYLKLDCDAVALEGFPVFNW